MKDNGSRTLEDLRTACEGQAECVAFNTDGCLKKTLAPQRKWVRPGLNTEGCVALYIKGGEQTLGLHTHVLTL
jgi:hypothetical protein